MTDIPIDFIDVDPVPIRPPPQTPPGRPFKDYGREDLLLWSPNECDTAFSGVFVRDGVPNPRDELHTWHLDGRLQDGFMEAVTINPIRGHHDLQPWNYNEDWGVDGNREVCKNHVGMFALDEEGFLVSVTGVHPEVGQERRANAVGYPVIMDAQSLIGHGGLGIELGDCVFVAGYPTPRPSEVILNSGKPRCGVAD